MRLLNGLLQKKLYKRSRDDLKKEEDTITGISFIESNQI